MAAQLAQHAIDYMYDPNRSVTELFGTLDGGQLIDAIFEAYAIKVNGRRQQVSLPWYSSGDRTFIRHEVNMRNQVHAWQ